MKTRHTWNGTPIYLYDIHPPIPTKEFDWQATLGEADEGVKYAHGSSQDIAVANLIQELWESGE